jgi:WD40 repeat protein/DNA-binding SARP family transcriptional activator
MRFRILGPMEVTDGGGRLPLGGPKQRLVLAHLILRANRVVASDLLIDEIWGEEPPAAARATLQSYVSNLRKLVGGDRLAGRPSGYLLVAPPEEIDAEQFEQLVARARRKQETDPAGAVRLYREALALWQGDALADLSGEPSLWPTIERLSELRLAALESRVRAELDLGRHADLVPELDALQAANPLREQLAGHLMLALYRSGRQDRALAAYHHLRKALAEELGIDPSPAIERLQVRILNHDPRLELRGEPLRGYRLIEQIGSGRFAAVHRALDPQAEREVAIKILGARAANDQGFIRSFDTAARRVARLEHPHVVPLHDWWREPDAAYFVMRLMRGGSVGQRVGTGRVAPEDLLLWTEQIGSALAAAHRHGVVHGDVRAANVLLDGEGNAYLGDFAIGLGSPAVAADDVEAFAAFVAELSSVAMPDPADAELEAVLRRATPINADRPMSPLELVNGVRRALVTGTQGRPDAPLGPDRNPYKGLRAFEEADVSDFFGRESVVAQLLERISPDRGAARLLAVVGPSGSGKSSLVAAGLLPEIRAGGASGSEEWFVTTMTPSERPFEQLERALLHVAIEAPDSLSMQLAARDGLRQAVGRVLPPRAELLLVIDQFEELFTLVDEGTRQRFLDLLAQTVDDRDSRVRLVITLRADFYDRPLRHQGLGRHLAASTVAIPVLTPDELERVIAAPAAAVGLRLGRGLLTRMVGETSHQAGALPLLQYALTELWERRDGDRLTLEAYELSGGVAAAVGRRAEELVATLDEASREMARQLFLRLIELGEGTPDTARRVRRSELQAIGTDGVAMSTVIDRFARYRLLLLDRDPETRGATIELAHEALLHAWPRLLAWVDDARDDLRTQRRLSAAASQWIDAGRDASFLLTGSRLEQIDQWTASTDFLLTDSEREFVAASLTERERLRKEEDRRRLHELGLERRAMTRLRGLVAVLAIGALAAGGLSVFALGESTRANREARVATARELSAASVANLDVDPERSILLALEAVHATRSVDGSVLPDAEDALHRAVNASRIVLRVPGLGGSLSWSPIGDVFVTEGPEFTGMLDIRSASDGASILEWHAHDIDVNAVAFSPDGSMLLSTGDDGSAAMWRTARGGPPLYRIDGHGEVWGPTISPDRRLAAAVWRDESILRIWDAATGADLREIPIPGTLAQASFSSDGSRLALPLLEGEVLLLDVASGELLPVTLPHGQHAFGADWSPDGRWIATAGRVPALRIWEADSGALKFSPPAHNGEATAVQWSPNGSRLASAGSDGAARLWDISEFGAHELLSVAAWDTATGVAGLAFSPDGSELMTGDWAVSGVQIWDIGPGGQSEWWTLPGKVGAQAGVAFAPTGELLWSDVDGTLTIGTFSNGRAARTVGTAGDAIASIAVSPNGELVAAAKGGERAASVWRSDSGVSVFDVALEGDVFAVDWSPDGAFLAIGDAAGKATVVNRSGDVVAELSSPRAEILAVQFNPNGRLLAVVRDASSVAIWDWERDEVTTLPFPARDVAFDSTGERIVTAGLLPDAKIWHVESGEALQTLAGQVAQLWGVAWSADDTRVYAGTFDGLIRSWDVEAGTPSLVLRGHGGPVTALALSSDGRQLASSSVDGTTRVWALDLDDLIGLAASKLQRLLTDEECVQYLHLEACPTNE